MPGLATPLSLVLLLTQSLPQTDSLERNRVVGLIGAQLDSQLTRFLFSPPRPPALEAYGWHVESTPEGTHREWRVTLARPGSVAPVEARCLS